MSADTQSAPLRNEYWLLRHGKSLANEAEIMVSALENGVLPKWSLAAAGEEQALVAGQRLQEVLASHPSRPLLCYSSPFSRAQRTAELALSQLDLPQAPPIQGALELRERYFGDTLELQPYAAAYGHVWEGDAQSVDHQPGGDGESVAMVGKRIRALFQALEDAHEGAIILLVSHGDTLSILEATMRGADTRQHRGYAFETAELRRLEA